MSTRHFLPVFSVVIIAILAFIIEQTNLGNSFTSFFVYQRLSISKGEIWRLFTGHFLHTNSYHLLLNLAALIMLWLLHGRFYTQVNYALLFLFSALSTSLGIYYFSPDLLQYVGLSGVEHGVLVFGAIMDIRSKNRVGYLLLLGLCLKIVYEQTYGASTEVSNLINANIAIDAHLWGALGGLLFAMIYPIIQNQIKPEF